ncbi:hypothetical protein R1flu_017697 [Riccia fluitans]|uniref:Uncharacterized protein n=1 Tax=Riccia fluitans TaxID=41844 RepID=A0ABD1ZH35_9MARC
MSYNGEETGRWIRNDEKMADFVREIAKLWDELLTKDAKMESLRRLFGSGRRKFSRDRLSRPRRNSMTWSNVDATGDSGRDDFGGPGVNYEVYPTGLLGQAPAEFQTPEGQMTTMETDTPTTTLLEKVRTKADLEAVFADLDIVQAQLDEEHERNSKLQERFRF